MQKQLKRQITEPARIISVADYSDMTCMDVMHRFLKEFRAAASQPANTAIFENPAHAVMTSKRYTLKLWVTERVGEDNLFDIKYEIEGDVASDPVNGRFISGLSKLNPANLFRRPKAANTGLPQENV